MMQKTASVAVVIGAPKRVKKTSIQKCANKKFLCWISTKHWADKLPQVMSAEPVRLKLKCLAQGHNTIRILSQ